MSEQSDKIVEATERHADLILRASGSALSHYTMTRTRVAILGAVMDCYEEAYRAGAKFADERKAAHIERIEALNAEAISLIKRLLAHRVGELPSRGWLRDNDEVRSIVAEMAALTDASLGEVENG